MKKLKKNFATETDELRAFITCRCPGCVCGCQNVYNSQSVQTATSRDQSGATQETSAFWNR